MLVYLLSSTNISVVIQMQITSQRLNDGDWHQLIFSRIGRRLRFSVDSQEVQIDAKVTLTKLFGFEFKLLVQFCFDPGHV